jgi:hypothetical protein
VNENHDGWKQIEAGLALVDWSGLAKVQGSDLALAANESDDRFERLAESRHAEYGRVLSWVVFSVGCEYILKGACQVRGLGKRSQKKVLDVPPWDANLDVWAKAAIKMESAALKTITTNGTLGSLPLAKMFSGVPGGDVHRASIELLRQTIRNRDAHQYVKNQRAAHFPAVSRMFVPALNALLESLPAKGP